MTDAERDAALKAYAELFYAAAPIIVMLTIVGLLVIVGLWWAWSRADRRWKGNRTSRVESLNVWQESGRRASQADDKPSPVRPSIPVDEDDIPFDGPEDDDNGWSPDDDEDDGEPWR